MISALKSNQQPFDAIAQQYDDLFTHSLIGRAQRGAVWAKMRTLFFPGMRILEINCGTGIDAVYLARMGVEVLALDSSMGMVAVAHRQVERACVQERVHVLQTATEKLDELRNVGRFDGALSNFGGLNCIQNLQKVGKDLAQLLKPGSPALLCWMGPWCCWEFLYYLMRRQPGKALRRMKKDERLVQLGDTHNLQSDEHVPLQGSHKSVPPLRVYYPSLSRVAASLAPHFRLCSFQAIGLTIPPSYLEHWVNKHRRYLRLAASLDARVSGWPGLRNLGDHYLVHLERV